MSASNGACQERQAQRISRKSASAVRPRQASGMKVVVPDASGKQLADLATKLRRQAALLLEWADAIERGERMSRPGIGLCEASEGESESLVFCRQGEYWKIQWRGRSIQLKHRVGFGYIHALLSSPGRAIPVLHLVGGAVEGPVVYTGNNTGTRRGLLHASVEAEEVMASLESELLEAEGNNDFERARVLRERRRLFAECLFGKEKNVVANAERARVAVAKAVHRALAAIAREHPELACHLQRRLRLGYSCLYDDFDDQLPRRIVT